MKTSVIASFTAAAGIAMLSAASFLHQRVEAAEPVATSGPALLELFTSQGCSSCPPADLLLGKLQKEGGVIVLTRPVTYWDGLGWKDTLARPENTELQRAYSRQMGEGGRIYTPQVVVNGSAGTVGSRAREIRELAAKSGRTQAVLAVEANADGSFGVGISGKGSASGQAELVLVAIDSSETVAIGRGENSGRSVTYTNVVRDERRLDSWSGGTRGVPISATALKTAKADRYAVILREPGGGPVLAARMLTGS